MGPGQRLLAVVEQAGHGSPGLLAALVAVSAFLEHLFPPFPGDLGVTLGAAVGFTVRGRAPWLFLSALGGNLLGSAVTYAFGRWLAVRADHSPRPWIQRMRGETLAVTERLAKQGLLVVAVSRFAPGIRAFVIVGAGFRAMPVAPVLGAAVLGAALWNVLLFTVAALVGKNLPRLAAWLDRYNRAALVVLLVVAAGLALRWLWKRRHPEP